MIRFNVERRRVVLEYEPEFVSSSWASHELKTNGEVTVSRAFTFRETDLISGPDTDRSEDTEEPTYRFLFARRAKGYFCVEGRILGVDQPILIADQGLALERKIFVAERNIRIFPRIAKVSQSVSEIVVGGDREDAIPVDVFRELLRNFPNSGELDRYASARVEGIIGEYLDGMRSARDNYETYLSKRRSIVSDAPLDQDQILQAEIDKYSYLRDSVSEWLKSASEYSELDWQRMITKVILLIFPKYVAVLESVRIADFYSSNQCTTKRYIDICLVDSSGNLDVIEIKRPAQGILVGKRPYRDNSVPARELSGSIMQAEKYLFHLSKWGVAGERELSKRHKLRLPAGMGIRITNPKAMIILGRDRFPDGRAALSENQLFDFEVIKRKYANMMDILTYDDLLRRLDNIIASLTQRKLAK